MSSLTVASKSFRIGIIRGGQRKSHVGDPITDLVLQTIESHISTETAANAASFTFDYIDLSVLALPLCDEPGIPRLITSPEDYAHDHTRVWSRRVAALDGVIFISPQQNWGIPAGLKNAIDYLFNEWKNKPAVIVGYGRDGADKVAMALKLCLAGAIGMQVGSRMVVTLDFPSQIMPADAVEGLDRRLDAAGEGSIGSVEREQIKDAWDQMVAMLESKGVSKMAIQLSQKIRRVMLALTK